MRNVVETAVIVGVFFLIGVIFGMLLVIGMSLIRTKNHQPGLEATPPETVPPEDGEPENDPDTRSSRWPDLTP